MNCAWRLLIRLSFHGPLVCILPFSRQRSIDRVAKAAGVVPVEKLELYEKLVATNPRVERKGATVPYTSLNGHMFSYLARTGTLALRLPAGARDAFLKK